MKTSRVPAIASSPAIGRVLAALEAAGEPLSVHEIAERAFIGLSTLQGGGYLRLMKDSGLIHVGGWRRGLAGFNIPLIALGAGDDVPRPRLTAQDRMSPGMLALLEALEQHGDMTDREAALAAGLSPNTVRNAGYMVQLHQQKRIHIASWRRSKNGPMAAVYGHGEGIDAPQPKAFSAAAKAQRYRDKQRILYGRRSLVEQLERIAA